MDKKSREKRRPHTRRNNIRHSDPGIFPPKKSVNALKSKIRDLERVLGHSDRLPADVRIEKERALAGYRTDLENVFTDKSKQKMISKYHKIRFFERQKATRHLKRARKRLNSASPESEEHERISVAVKDAEIDLNYTIYYPLTAKYVSLFRGAGEVRSTDDSNVSSQSFVAEEVATRKLPMWDIVKKCTEDGTLQRLRDGKLSALYTSPAASAVEAKKTAVPLKKAQTAKPDQASDDESDGGFFET